jgi:hypothetical protein
MEPEPSQIYSNRSYWYAQSQVSDYSTATIRFTVPPAFTAACSGEQAQGSPVMLRPATPDAEPRKLHVFSTPQPVRYLACVTSRFTTMDPPAAGASAPGSQRDRAVDLHLLSTARQRSRARESLAKAAEIIDFYASVMGEVPYRSLTLAVVESNIPGGHAPRLSGHPQPALADNAVRVARRSRRVRRLSPTSSSRTSSPISGGDKPSAGRTITSSGSAKASRSTSPRSMRNISEGGIVQCAAPRARAVEHEMSDQGPIYLGYRLGHVKGDGRIFRALVYNKGASVLHMLRRMLGDDVFFRSLRRFYADRHFEKAGTADLRKAFEQESGRSLGDILRSLDHGPGSADAFRIAYDLGGRILCRRSPRTACRAHVRVPGDCVVDLRGRFSRRRDGHRGWHAGHEDAAAQETAAKRRGESGSDYTVRVVKN